MAQLPSALRSQIDSYRESLSTDIESSATLIENYLGGWGQQNAFGNTPFDISSILGELDALLAEQKATLVEGNRNVNDQGLVGAPSDVPFDVTIKYDESDYSNRIIPNANLDYTPQDISKYTIPIYQSDTIVYEDIERLRLLELSDTAINAIANDGIKNAEFEANANMDLASANLGSRGFRSVNSWLSAKHADEANKVTDLYYKQYRAAIEAKYKFAEENLMAAASFYPLLDSTAMQTNLNLAQASAQITKALFEVQGILNTTAIDSFAMQKKAMQTTNSIINKLDLMTLSTMARKIEAEFNANLKSIGAAWQAEITQIENELVIETAAVDLDDNARSMIISTGLSKLDVFLQACNTQLSFEVDISKQKAEGLKNKFDKIVAVATGATVSTIGIDRYK